MGSVRASRRYPGSVHEAEQCWYNSASWPLWVDGLDEVVAVQGDWPRVGGCVSWRSGPAGRGSVRETAISYEPRRGQTAAVEDDSIRGEQTVAFSLEDGGVRITLRLEYEIKQRSLVTPLVDFFFIRPAMTRSLQSTLDRFAGELVAHPRHLG